MRGPILIVLYLVAIILANLSVAYFGPISTPINAFLLIGLDLTCRDSLHDMWRRRGLVWKMGLLIVAGSLLTVMLNKGAAQVALASTAAFAATAIADTVFYQLLWERGRIIRVNGSNVVGALVDSVVFPTIAFGMLIPWVIIGQFMAKVAGGYVWSLILKRTLWPKLDAEEEK